MKECLKCLTIKDEVLFSKDTNREDGLCRYCKECVKKYYYKYKPSRNLDVNPNKTRSWYLANRERMLKLAKLRYDKKRKKKENEPKDIRTKECSRCSMVKSFSDYYKNPECTDGILSFCKSCTLVYQRGYYEKSKGKSGNCITCDTDFSINRHQARGVCHRCYSRDWYHKSQGKDISNNENLTQLKIDNKENLLNLIESIERKCLYVDVIDSFKIANMFMIYSNVGNVIDGWSTEDQLIYMFDYLLKTKTGMFKMEKNDF